MHDSCLMEIKVAEGGRWVFGQWLWGFTPTIGVHQGWDKAEGGGDWARCLGERDGVNNGLPTKKHDLMWFSMPHHQWFPINTPPICAMFMPRMVLNLFGPHFSSSFDVCIRCVWGDLVKLVNLQMAGLNEQQGYVLRLTSGEGYKEERVEVGIWGLLLEDPWMVKT